MACLQFTLYVTNICIRNPQQLKNSHVILLSLGGTWYIHLVRPSGYSLEAEPGEYITYPRGTDKNPYKSKFRTQTSPAPFTQAYVKLIHLGSTKHVPYHN